MVPLPAGDLKCAEEKKSFTYSVSGCFMRQKGGKQRMRRSTWRPWPRRARILRHRARQRSAKAEKRASSAATVGGIGCWALLFMNSPKLKALRFRLDQGGRRSGGCECAVAHSLKSPTL